MPHRTQPSRPLSPEARAIKELHHDARLTGMVGVTFAILFAVSVFAFSEGPRPGATDADVAAFYQAGHHQLVRVGGLYLLPLAAIAFLWFVASLHAWVELSGHPIDRLMSTVQMLGGVSFVTLALAASAAATVVSFSYEQYVITPDLARQFPLYGRTLLVVFGMRMAALFVMSTAKLGHSSGLLPTWFQWLSIIVALVLFASASLNVWLTLIFPVWVVLLCALIWLRRSLRPEPAVQPVDP
ncbi:MAG: hypothetical protein U0Z70_19730 [Thermomicrobiales bacterium]|nr:hypothetical protein [Chloroflexia bacterium]